MSTKINLLFTGVTGFIGGSVFQLFLDHPDVESFNLVVLVRSAEKAKKLTALGANAVVGSLEDLDLLEELASKADYILSMADSDNLNATKAILRGARKYHKATSNVPSIIHTSGTGAIADNSAPGENTAVEIYDDSNSDQIASIPETNSHRNVDTELVRADQEGYVRTYTILPSDIYGLATGTLVDQGIQNPRSIQIPSLISAALARGRGGMVGRGQNVWNNVHIQDLTNLYLIIFNTVRSTPDQIGHGRDGVFIAENGEHNLYDVGKAIGETLVALGKATDSEPSTFTDEEIQLYFKGSTFWGSTSRGQGNRGKSIGWKPTRSTADLLASIRPETESLLSRV